MDPLSATASIIAILQLSGKVLSYLNDVKDASQGRAQCAIEVANLHGLLFQLRFRIEGIDSKETSYIAIQALTVEKGPLDQFKEALEMLEANMTGRGRLLKAGRALLWKFKKEEIACILDRMERLKTSIGVVLALEHFHLSQNIKGDTEYFRTHVPSIESGVDAIQLQQDSAKHYKLLEWISHTDYPAQQSAIIKDRQEGTGQWFLAAPEVTQWKSEVKATLFCPGIPGAGKTMMAAIAIDHLQRSVQSDFHGVAYIYCNYKAQQQQDLTSMLAAILKQLTQGQSPSLAYVERLHERHAKHGTKPSLKDIYNTLEQVCSLYQTVYIVIDALDECQDSTRRQLLTKVHDLQTRRDVRLMVTSRSMPEIESEYQTALRLEVRATKEDIKRFVAHQIHRLPMCIRRDPTLQELVQERIIEAVDGMFLLAVLHIDSLLDKRLVKDVRLVLATMLKGAAGVRKAYQHAFQRIESQMPGDRELAKKVLSWITLAKRPLTPSELCYALAVETGESKIDPDNIPDSSDLVSVCAGLVVVDEVSAIIRLVHYTTQEYLEQTIDAWNPEARLHIAVACLDYLALNMYTDGFVSRGFVRGHSFRGYAVNYWGVHVGAVEADVIQVYPAERLRDALSCVVGDIRKSSRMSSESGGDIPKNRNLPYLGRCGLVHIMGIIFSDPGRYGLMAVDHGDEYERAALSYAAQHGHIAVVELLLEKGANVNKLDIYGGNALQAASATGHREVVELLLDQGAELNIDEKGCESALYAASANGYEEIVELLLSRGAKINAQTEWGSTALHEAAARGHEQVAKILLDKGAEINLQDQYSCNALWAASNSNQKSMIKLLLKAGSDISSQHKLFGSVVHQAAFWDELQIVQLFISKGAEVNLDSEYLGSPLYIASVRGYEQVAHALLQAGADPNMESGEHGNALFAASVHGYKEIVELLLAKGAFTNTHGTIKDEQYGTEYINSPLYAASSRGHEEVVELLIKEGAHVNEEGGYYSNALFVASVKGYEKVVKLLLAGGADPNVHCTKHKNGPLYAASSKGDEKVVELLVKNGAHINAEGGYYGSALFVASINGYEKVVKLLLEGGADPNVQGTKYKNTPLYAASSRGLKEIVRLLLDNGADVNAQGGYLGNALIAASKAGCDDVVKLLVDRGADSS